MDTGKLMAMWTLLILIIIPSTQSTNPSTVAFTEGQASHMQIINGDIMIYDTHITSINSDIDEYTGEFVCNSPGLYIFHFYALTYKGFKLWFELHHNGNYVVSLYGYTSSDYADAGNSVLLYLNLGDKVYVKAHELYNNVLFGKNNEIYTTFTGALLKLDDGGNGTDDTSVFSAGLNYHAAFLNGHNILYNHVFFGNVSNGYGFNSHTGVFVAPKTGTYLFHYHGISIQGRLLWLELHHNNQYVNSIYGHTATDNADAGNTAILNLHKSDRVFVKSRTNLRIDLYGTSEEIYCTFSGALIFPSAQRLHIRQNTQNKEFAFSVGLSSNRSQSAGHRVVFDRMFSNTGNAFDLATGIFTTKVSGVYVFHFHALSQPGKPVWIDLYHNYKYIDSVYGHVPNGKAAGGNSASLELIAGDKVFLDIGHHDSWLYGDIDGVFCTFSGYLLSLTSDYRPPVVG